MSIAGQSTSGDTGRLRAGAMKMLATIDDLIAYSHRLASGLPDLRGSIVIDRPGCSEAEIAALVKALPDLPDSYTSVAKNVKLDGVAIGYFQLSPGCRGNGLVEKLVVSNDPLSTPMASRCQAHDAYLVASWEADAVAVAHAATTFNIGQVVKYNIGNPMARPTVLADDFEHFLLIAGTLDEIRDKHGDDPAEAVGKFSAYLTPIVVGRKDDMAATWKMIAEVVLS
jgi:hypothetical protein